MTLIDRIALARLRWLGARSLWTPSSYGPLHCLELSGDGPLPELVLLHGMGARATHFVRLVPHLRHRFRRILIPDLLGHGLSPTPDAPLRGDLLLEHLCPMLDGLLRDRAVVYGNSLGGYAAIGYAARAPERVSALVVNSPAGGVFRSLTVQRYLDRFRVHTHREAVAFTHRYFGSPLGPLRHLLAQGAIWQLRAPVVQALMDAVDEDDFLDPAQIRSLRMPSLLLWGQRDGIMLDEQLDYFRAHLPDSVRVERPEQYGHAPYIEHPADLGQRIHAFLDEVLDEARAPTRPHALLVGAHASARQPHRSGDAGAL